MKIAIGQINSTIGDFEGNRQKILAAAAAAKNEGAEIVVFPELALCGYPPMDLLDHDAFVEENQAALRTLQQDLPRDIAIVTGYVDRSPEPGGKGLRNVAAVIRDGTVLFRQAKRLLPTYDVFDEARYFEPARESRVWTYGEHRVGIAICEDIWWEAEAAVDRRYPVDPVRDLLDAGATVILAPSASPFHVGKKTTRTRLVSSIGRSGGVPVVYVNCVGGNDSLIFDGASIATDNRGEVIHQSPGFTEDVCVVDISATARDREPAPPGPHQHRSMTEDTPSPLDARDLDDLENALVLGIRDYLEKTGFRSVHLGLSGGIDSALVAVLAARAAGPDRVHAFLMPSQYSSPGSISDSEMLAENLGIPWSTVPIQPIYDSFTEALKTQFAGTDPGVAEENIQARVRGTLLMSWSNKFGSLTLTTGNKSELAVGYCTLYGDMAGALAVIGDLFKTEVYALCRHINRDKEIIPDTILTKPPSAELRPNQTDQDSLPPYPVLDRILARYLIFGRTGSQIIAEGHDGATVTQVLNLVGRSEYKRRQAPPVLKVSPRAFGTGRRMPIARRIYETRS